MAALAIVHERLPDASWRPIAVLFGTRNRLDFRVLPGQPGWQAWAESLAENASPPYKDGIGIDPERGTWEDFIPWAVNAFSNGHDTWLTQIAEPEPTLDANYEKYVLANPEPDLTPPPLRPAQDIPELGGFTKVTPR